MPTLLATLSPVKHSPPVVRPASIMVTSTPAKDNAPLSNVKNTRTTRKPLGPRAPTPPSSPSTSSKPMISKPLEKNVNVNASLGDENEVVVSEKVYKDPNDVSRSVPSVVAPTKKSKPVDEPSGSVKDRMQMWERERERLKEMERLEELMREENEERKRKRRRAQEERERRQAREQELQREREMEQERQRQLEQEKEREQEAEGELECPAIQTASRSSSLVPTGSSLTPPLTPLTEGE